MRKVKKWRKEQQDKILCGYESGGMSVKEYCQEQGVAPSTFHTWRRKQQEPQDSPKRGFIKIKGYRKGSSDGMRIDTPGGYRLEIPAGVSGDWVKRILQAVRVR